MIIMVAGGIMPAPIQTLMVRILIHLLAFIGPTGEAMVISTSSQRWKLVVTIKRVSECVSLKLDVTSFQYCVISYKYSNRYFINIATVNPPIVHTHVHVYISQETQHMYRCIVCVLVTDCEDIGN